ncbi:MAG: hypothetical protein HQL52_17740 [Magnetococcales bacterium]|nr:hypothetical protein [Magnetococcales bacterium]
MSNDNIIRLASLFRAASQQRKALVPRAMDRHFINQGGHLMYAVDTDIVVLYTDTLNNALPSGNRKEGYSQIFPGEDEEVSVALGWALARFIFFHHLNGDGCPLIVLPPYDQEVARVFARVAKNAKNEQETADQELFSVRSLVEELKQEPNQEKRLERLAASAPTLFVFLQGQTGASAELRRFGEILNHSCIAPLALVQEHEGWLQGDPIIREALSIDQNEMKCFLRLREFREAWFDRLKKTKSPNTSNLKLIDDATALAHLEWINGRFRAKSHRLVMISGDVSMHEAAQSYFPPGIKHSFADLFLRHPRAYLAEPEVLLPDIAESGDNHSTDLAFSKWLDLFLAEPCALAEGCQDNMPHLHDLTNKDLGEIAAQVLKTHPQIVVEFESAWQGYTRYALTTHLSDVPKDGVPEPLQDLLQDVESLLNALERELRQKSWDTWSVFVGVATLAGIELFFAKPKDSNQPPPRNVPLLTFRSYPEARNLLWSLLKERESGRLSSQDYHDLLEKVKQEDPTSYAFFIVFGVLFATGGNWHLAAVLGEQAWQIANRGENHRNTGRESAYLTTVALRHSIQNLSTDLPRIEMWLTRAINCLSEERKAIPDKLAGEARFVCEGQAIHLTVHLFNLFKGDSLEGISVPDLATLQSQITATIDSLCLSDETDEIEYGLNLNVERNLLTNLFMTIFLRVGHNGESLTPSDYNHYFERFQANITIGNDSSSKHAIRLSYLVKVIFDTADIWMHADRPDSKRKLRNLKNSALTEYYIPNNKVLPYDVERFRFLLHFADQCR